jgi:hypothetical protein
MFVRYFPVDFTSLLQKTIPSPHLAYTTVIGGSRSEIARSPLGVTEASHLNITLYGFTPTDLPQQHT